MARLPAEDSAMKRKGKYLVQYQNNNSKKGDGKSIWLEPEWLKSLYQSHQLVAGCKLELPWLQKGNKEIVWKAILLDPDDDVTDKGKDLYVSQL